MGGDKMKEKEESQKRGAAEVAADWWVEKIYGTAPDKFNMGEESYQAMMAQMLAMTNSLRNTPEEEKKEKLRSRLIEMISEELKQRGSCNLCTDYHPEGDLYRISKELDISESSFPWKTNMNITEYEVEVKCGYGASYETLYSK